jgi:small-conductance mechanosensitive channel
MDSWMKSRQWLVALGLLALVLAAIAGSFLTRDLGTPSTSISQPAPGEIRLVDERPLKTARAMGKLASGADEQQVANLAAQLGDDEVDLAFHDALRDATDHPPQSKPQFRPLYEHASQIEAQVKADQDSVNQLKKQVAAANAARVESLQEQLDVAQAQLELDQDELNDAHEDLVRSGADPGSLIQRQFDQHQATEHDADQKTSLQTQSSASVNYQAGSLIAQFLAWEKLRQKAGQLQRAHDGAALAAARLTQAHEALEKQVTAEKSTAQAKRLTEVPAPGNAAPPTRTASSAVKALHLLSDDQKTLADFDKRIEDEKELQTTYLTWIALVRSHQRAALHGMIQSAQWILLILLAVFISDRVIDHYLAEAGEERTRLHTLRAVFHFVAQAAGALLIAFVIFGAPQQLPTIIGFAGAGLTVALKDFIVGFFGWFVLMGKNGIRVGDWVEINGVAGEVIEINLLRTILLETGNWTDTGHPTGRKVAFVNSYAIEGHFFNFTTSGQWLWDELAITVPGHLDPYLLIDHIQQAVAKETEANVRMAEEEWRHMTKRYRVRAVSAAPAVNLRPTATGVELYVRYITRAQERFAMRARLNQALVQLLRQGLDEKQNAPKPQ